MITIGVIGLGFGQEVHVPAFKNNSRCLIYAIAGQSEKKAAQTANRLGISKHYSNYSLLLQNPDIEAVSIAVPPYVQSAVVAEAIANKKHIFCEKPLGCGSFLAKKFAQLAKESNLVAAVDFEFPTLITWHKAKEIIESKKLGEIVHIAIDWHIQTYTNRTKIKSWKSNHSEGGGTLNNFVSHVFYNLEWLAGPISDLCCKIQPTGNQLVQVMLSFLGGHSGNISVSTNTPFAQRHTIEVFFKEGRLVLENLSNSYLANFRLQVISDNGTQIFNDPVSGGIGDSRVIAVGRLVDAFVDAIENPNSCPLMPGLADGARVETLLEESLISDNLNRWIKITV